MKLYLVRFYDVDVDRWIVCLIWAKDYKEAKRDVKTFLVKQGARMRKDIPMRSHDITFDQDTIRRIDYLL